MFKKILIANRGEIAVRIINACKELGIKSSAIYSDADITSLHTRLADEAHYIGASPASESYLNKNKILELAKILVRMRFILVMVSFLRMLVLLKMLKKWNYFYRAFLKFR